MASRSDSANVQLKLRLKEILRAQLERHAGDRGVSMNSEIVERLEQTFRERAFLLDALEASYGTGLAGILLALGEAMKTTGNSAGFASTMRAAGAENWFDDPYSFDQVYKAAVSILAAMRPAGAIKLPPTARVGNGSRFKSSYENLGEGFARGILSEIASDGPMSTASIERAPRLRRYLGPELVKRVKTFLRGG